MTKIKLCGLTRKCDIEWANELKPEYIGFVFFPKSIRNVGFEKAMELRESLNDDITPVGVFVNEGIESIEYLVKSGVVGMVQLHGSEDNEYIKRLRCKVTCPIIQAFRIETEADIKRAEKSGADYIMLDAGGGTGQSFNHKLIDGIKREFFLAGGLDSKNIQEAIINCRPYAVDVSSSLETNGVKDRAKMAEFVKAVRNGG